MPLAMTISESPVVPSQSMQSRQWQANQFSYCPVNYNVLANQLHAPFRMFCCALQWRSYTLRPSGGTGPIISLCSPIHHQDLLIT